MRIALRHSFGEATDQPVADQEIYLLRQTVTKRRIPEMSGVFETMQSNDSLPPGLRTQYQTRFRDMVVQAAPGDPISISNYLVLLFASHQSKDRKEDIRLTPLFIHETVLPMLSDPDKNLLVWKGVTGPDGKTDYKKLSRRYTVFTWAITKDTFHVWAVDYTVDPKKGDQQTITLNDENISYAH